MIVIPLLVLSTAGVATYMVYRGFSGSGGSWTAKSGVVLNGTLERFLDKVASHSGVTFIVSSGTRSAAAQASALMGKVAGGNTPDDLRRLYNDDLINEILARPSSEWAAVIASQTARGVGLSSHLRGAGVDISVRRADGGTLTAAEKSKIIAAGMASGASSYQHEDIGTSNEHIHFTVEGISGALTLFENLSTGRKIAIAGASIATTVGTVVAGVYLWRRRKSRRKNPRRPRRRR
jgi:hypothetical protein